MITLNASQWGLFSHAYPEETANVAKEMNKRAFDFFKENTLERLNRREIIKLAYQLYREFSDKYGHLGAGDTEGRYGVEDAVAQYLHDHDINPEKDLNLSGDYLLWER